MTSISARHDHDHAVVSATVGVRFERGSPGRCGCSGNALHSTGRKSSDDEHLPHDRRGRLGGDGRGIRNLVAVRGAEEAELRDAALQQDRVRERDAGDRHTAVAGGLADEQGGRPPLGELSRYRVRFRRRIALSSRERSNGFTLFGPERPAASRSTKASIESGIMSRHPTASLEA